MSNGSASGFCNGLLVGAIAGVIVGLLFAPKTGKEMREMVRERAGDVAEGAKSGFNRIKSPFGKHSEEPS